jgi:hypothetical protein
MRSLRNYGLLLILLCVPLTVDAACTGSSPSWTTNVATLQTCITGATSGDTITVTDSGTAAAAATSTKALTITGPGKATLTLTGNLTYSPTTGEASKTYEVSGFTFSGNNVFRVNNPNGTTPVTGLKIHDNAFINASVRAIQFTGLEYGVFYLNTFSGNNISVSIIGAGNNGQNYPHAFGSANYPYFEDNTFGQGVNSFVTETGQGGRLAFRHNTVDGYSCNQCEIHDAHGDQNTGGYTISGEYYHNVYQNITNTQRWLHHRGGQSIVANNTVSGNHGFNFTEYRAWGGNGLCSAYPAVGQINNAFYFNNVINGVVKLPTYTDESSSTNNCGNPKPDGVHEASGYVVLNREYWTPTFGVASARPATCTANGNTFYGATDTDAIYKCTATNVWTIFYTPYTYPHPLRAAAPPGDCSRATVAAAISAATYGDTVLVAACAPTTWSTPITITKGLTLQGAGIDTTTIKSGVTGGLNSFLFVYQPDATSIAQNLPFEVSGFTFDLNNTQVGGLWIKNSNLTTPITKVNIHDNLFKNVNTSGSQSGSEDVACIRTGSSVSPFVAWGDVWGVIYNNTFTDCGTVGENYGGDVNSWNNTTFTPGSQNNLYWEDNVMTGNSVFFYGGLGGRYVSRFNTLTFTTGIFQTIWDFHGNQTGNVCSTMGVEIYRNTVASSGSATGLDARGGMAMVFDNTLTGNANGWQIRDEANESQCPESNPQPQYISNAYFGLNTRNGTNITPTLGPENVQPLVANTNYWLYQAAFTGAVGTGRGTLAARPATCTTGVGYWATDQGNWNTLGTSGRLYKCTATNTWNVYYTPLPYPHPLRGGSVPGDTDPPSPPGNLRLVSLGASSILLTWDASTDGTAVTGYLVEHVSGGACNGFIQVGTPTIASYTDSLLLTNTDYCLRVRATDAAGNLSLYSNTLSVTTDTVKFHPTLNLRRVDYEGEPVR